MHSSVRKNKQALLVSGTAAALITAGSLVRGVHLHGGKWARKIIDEKKRESVMDFLHWSRAGRKKNERGGRASFLSQSGVGTSNNGCATVDLNTLMTHLTDAARQETAKKKRNEELSAVLNINSEFGINIDIHIVTQHFICYCFDS